MAASLGRPAVVLVGSHLGYPMDRTPLGGGAMVAWQLARHYHGRPASWPDFRLVAAGSGPESPAPSIEYVRLPYGPFEGRDEGLVGLSELRYARFCRQFEAASTEWILARRRELPPESTCVLANDICEGPDLPALRRAGYRIVSIWHVDVVDYFNKMYLGGAMSPRSAVKAFEAARDAGLTPIVPDVLRLVFNKQAETVHRSSAMIFPSRGMAATVRSCYGGLPWASDLAGRCRVIPWGSWNDECSEGEVRTLAESARRHYQISDQTTVLLTISRVSPEKGLHLLLEALRLLEVEGRLRGDICLLLCGEPAFMRGQAYWRRVRAAAARLRQARVFFPGYLSPAEKKAFFRVSQLFVSPSVHESYGLNVAEALRGGVAVLASDHYGVAELLEESYGRVVRYDRGGGRARALADALESLMADRVALSEMGRRAAAAGAGMSFDEAARRAFETALEPLRQARPAGKPA